MSDYQAKLQELVFSAFYRTPRKAFRTKGGGGPFGFDIHNALEVCYLIESYPIDAIFETGTNAGDTTEFLARVFSDTPILSCEINRKFAVFAALRLSPFSNATVTCKNSAEVLKREVHDAQFPFFFLDAHWEEYWPLEDELASIKRGIVCVHDFDIGSLEFSFDEYDGVRINEELIRRVLGNDLPIYVNNHESEYPYPCLQRGRRSGRGYFVLGDGTNPFDENPWFRRLSVPSLTND